LTTLKLTGRAMTVKSKCCHAELINPSYTKRNTSLICLDRYPLLTDGANMAIDWSFKNRGKKQTDLITALINWRPSPDKTGKTAQSGRFVASQQPGLQKRKYLLSLAW